MKRLIHCFNKAKKFDIKKLLDENFLFIFQFWGGAKTVLVSILLASFFINLLSLAFPLALLQIYDRIIPNAALITLFYLTLGVFCALILEALLRVARSYVSAWADAKFEHIAGLRAFTKLLQSSLPEFEQTGTGIYLKRINALSQLKDFYSGQALVSLIDLPFALLLLIFIAYIAHGLVLVPIMTLTALIVLTSVHTTGLKELVQIRQSHEERRVNFIIETLSNIHSVKANTMEAQMMRRYERLQRVSSINDYDVMLKSSEASIFGMSLSQVTVVLVVIMGAIMVINGQLTVGGLTACSLLAGRCLQPVNNVLRVLSRINSIQLAQQELQQLINLPGEENKNLPDIPSLKGDIKFINVSYRPGPQEPWALKNINLEIKAGETIAVVSAGQEDPGTLLLLILGIIKPTEGKLLIDDLDIGEYNLASLRQQIAYMPQKSVLFTGTIMENLTLFQVNEYAERAKIAAKLIGLDAIVNNLPKGYGTLIASQATDSLSRGINQKIIIARALIHHVPMVLFDEANTAMDIQGDELLKNCLHKLQEKCTLVLISHRPSIINLAQKIYRIENGQLSRT